MAFIQTTTYHWRAVPAVTVPLFSAKRHASLPPSTTTCRLRSALAFTYGERLPAWLQAYNTYHARDRTGQTLRCWRTCRQQQSAPAGESVPTSLLLAPPLWAGCARESFTAICYLLLLAACGMRIDLLYRLYLCCSALGYPRPAGDWRAVGVRQALARRLLHTTTTLPDCLPATVPAGPGEEAVVLGGLMVFPYHSATAVLASPDSTRALQPWLVVSSLMVFLPNIAFTTGLHGSSFMNRHCWHALRDITL